MKILNKLILPILIIGAVFVIYHFYFAPNSDLGSFSKFSTGSEINQEINVEVVQSKGFRKNKDGQIISFYAKDISGKIVFITVHEPLTDEITKAKIVKLLGHIHSDSFTAAKVTILD
ncbi:hypothetical protein BMS3Abin04_00319 [bacterium BMS3Abin04]|nr:hypothetical protein BMS3Abin04_00319 [bacterium BMS3Abin04]